MFYDTEMPPKKPKKQARELLEDKILSLADLEEGKAP